MQQLKEEENEVEKRDQEKYQTIETIDTQHLTGPKPRQAGGSAETYLSEPATLAPMVSLGYHCSTPLCCLAF